MATTKVRKAAPLPPRANSNAAGYLNVDSSASVSQVAMNSLTLPIPEEKKIYKTPEDILSGLDRGFRPPCMDGKCSNADAMADQLAERTQRSMLKAAQREVMINETKAIAEGLKGPSIVEANSAENINRRLG